MSEREATATRNLAEIIKVLPPEEKNRLLGYAEGMAVMAERLGTAKNPPAPKEDR